MIRVSVHIPKDDLCCHLWMACSKSGLCAGLAENYDSWASTTRAIRTCAVSSWQMTFVGHPLRKDYENHVRK